MQVGLLSSNLEVRAWDGKVQHTGLLRPREHPEGCDASGNPRACGFGAWVAAIGGSALQMADVAVAYGGQVSRARHYGHCRVDR